MGLENNDPWHEAYHSEAPLLSHPGHFSNLTTGAAVNPHQTTASSFVSFHLPLLPIRLERLELRLFQTVVGSGVNYFDWTMAGTTLVNATVDTKTIAASTWTTYVYVPPNFGTPSFTPASDMSDMTFTLHGAPGTLYLAARLQFRLLKLI